MYEQKNQQQQQQKMKVRRTGVRTSAADIQSKSATNTHEQQTGC